MSKTWLYADPHFGHSNIVKFTRHDGSALRPWDNIQEHDEALILRYNTLVQPEDRVYILGDFGNWRVAERLLGRKVLVKGNHDQEKLSRYQAFDDIRGCVVKKGFILTHIPIHPACMGRWSLNIHGHLHYRHMAHAGEVHTDDSDPRYACVSVERTDFRPILLDDVLKANNLK